MLESLRLTVSARSSRSRDWLWRAGWKGRLNCGLLLLFVLGCGLPHRRKPAMAEPQRTLANTAIDTPEEVTSQDALRGIPATQVSHRASCSHERVGTDLVVMTSAPPPRMEAFEEHPRWAISLDEAVHIAIENSTIVRGLGGRVLTLPNSVRSTYDPSIVSSDARLGTAAALSAFDTQFESGFVWNGGGAPVNSAFGAGQFGVFAQPETMAKVGFGRVLSTGTKVSLGGVGGYDSKTAGGLYAAYGGQIRHPLMRGYGKQVNQIAGPGASPGVYRGVLITRIEEHQAQLELEQAIYDLTRDVSNTYWELYFAYQDLNTKRAALDSAAQSWHQEKQRVEAKVVPADNAALAKQQYYSARAAVLNSIGGTGVQPGGILGIEVRLRRLLGLPISDGQILFPSAKPLEMEFLCDWDESVFLATERRIELRKQKQVIHRCRLEVIAAQNLRKPQVDFIGGYRRLADDGSEESELFSDALNGWQVGIEYKRSIRNRRENSGVRNAHLKLHRELALLEEQKRGVMAELRLAFTQLDRAYHVMDALQVSRTAAQIRLNAEAKRHAEGDTQVERVLQAQLRATQAETAFQRSLVDYNTAMIRVHLARGTLFDLFGVGFADPCVQETRFVKTSDSPFCEASETVLDEQRPQIAVQPDAAADVLTE